MTTLLFWLIALAVCGSAIGVVVEKNVVRMAFWLVMALGGVAGIFFLLGADLVGVVQLMVYVGGTVVLLIFGVMLTATGPLSRAMVATKGEQLLAGIIAASLLGIISVSVLAVDWTRDEGREARAFAEGGTTRPLGLMLLGLDAERLRSEVRGQKPEVGGEPASGYLLPFEIASMHLLVVLIGAAYLARAKGRRENEGPASRGIGGRNGPSQFSSLDSQAHIDSPLTTHH